MVANASTVRRERLSDDEKVRRSRTRALTTACADLLQAEVREIEYPGGRTRESYLIHLTDGRQIIGTQRDSDSRAVNECMILRALADGGAPVPRLLGADGKRILLQEALTGQRLSIALQTDDAEARFCLLDNALDGLRHAQLAACAGGIEGRLSSLGTQSKWIRAFVERPAILGEYLKVQAPRLDDKALVRLLKPRQTSFVKWDARPGNAMVSEAGVVSWFDWEHAGLRNPLDDVAWLLADEYVRDDVDVEERLLARHLCTFGQGIDPAVAREYLMVYGTFHAAVRLGLILRYRGDDWMDLERCLTRDKVGCTLTCAENLCTRAARWSLASPLTAPLSDWYQAVTSALRRL